MNSFGELQTVTLADRVENRLLAYMRQASLTAGDPLPKEEELASHLNVSRHIVREGISRLKALGLIESRKKRGTVMKRPSAFTGLLKLAEADLFDLREREEFMELRVALELGMCDFIFARKTPEKLTNLRKVAGLPGSTVQKFATEVDFHTCLMEIGGNRIASQFREILANVFKPVYEGKAHVNRTPRTSTHHEICDILEHGTFEEFQAVMRKHFQPYLSAFRK